MVAETAKPCFAMAKKMALSSYYDFSIILKAHQGKIGSQIGPYIGPHRALQGTIIWGPMDL